MRLNSKVTGGLAWAGLVVVLAVPSAEVLTKPSAKSVTVISGMDAVETASVAPAVTPVVPSTRKPAVTPARQAATAAGEADVVDDYILSGKKLPSYISDVPEGVAQEPTGQLAAPAKTRQLVVPATTAAASAPAAKPEGTLADDDKADVAAVAPKPYPASMRPRPPVATAALAPADEAPLIINEADLAQREAAFRPAEPIVPAEPEQIVTGDELEEWDSGSLADYLERKGLINDSDLAAERLDSQFDKDGFFLSDGPNNSRAKRRRVNDNVDFFLF